MSQRLACRDQRSEKDPINSRYDLNPKYKFKPIYLNSKYTLLAYWKRRVAALTAMHRVSKVTTPLKCPEPCCPFPRSHDVFCATMALTSVVSSKSVCKRAALNRKESGSHLRSKACRKLPPTTTESSKVATACGQDPGMSIVSPGPSSASKAPSTSCPKNLPACPGHIQHPSTACAHLLNDRQRDTQMCLCLFTRCSQIYTIFGPCFNQGFEGFCLLSIWKALNAWSRSCFAHMPFS